MYHCWNLKSFPHNTYHSWSDGTILISESDCIRCNILSWYQFNFLDWFGSIGCVIYDQSVFATFKWGCRCWSKIAYNSLNIINAQFFISYCSRRIHAIYFYTNWSCCCNRCNKRNWYSITNSTMQCLTIKKMHPGSSYWTKGKIKLIFKSTISILNIWICNVIQLT